MSEDRPIIRPMQAGDGTRLVALARELAAAVDDPEPRIGEADIVRDGLGPERWFDCFVAEIAHVVVGYALFGRGFEAHTGKRRLWLGDLYVTPTARGRGVGRALIATVARHALQLGCDAVYWELWRQNSAGAAFYRSLQAEEVTDLAVMRLDKDRLAALAARN